MKQSADFLCRQVAGRHVVVPVGAAAVRFPGMIDLNGPGVMLWDLLETEQTEDSLVAALLAEYEVSEDRARQDVKAFLEKLRAVNAITE